MLFRSGREHIHALASLFYPDAPNDIAPRGLTIRNHGPAVRRARSILTPSSEVSSGGNPCLPIHRSHDRQRIGSASSSGSGSELDSSLDNQRTGELGHDESTSAGDSEDVFPDEKDG